jgi:hypothetical protein
MAGMALNGHRNFNMPNFYTVAVKAKIFKLAYNSQPIIGNLSHFLIFLIYFLIDL